MKSGRWVWVAMAALCAVLATMVVVRSRAALPGAVLGRGARSPAAAPSALVPSGAPLVPDFTVVDFDGRTLKSADFRGKVTILNFWATWCGPCRIEIPEFVALQKRYPDRLQIVGLSMDDSAAYNVKRFADAQKVNYRVGMATPEIAARSAASRPCPPPSSSTPRAASWRGTSASTTPGRGTREYPSAGGPALRRPGGLLGRGARASSAKSPTRPIPGVDLSGLSRPAARRAGADELGALHLWLRSDGRAVPPERPDL